MAVWKDSCLDLGPLGYIELIWGEKVHWKWITKRICVSYVSEEGYATYEQAKRAAEKWLRRGLKQALKCLEKA